MQLELVVVVDWIWLLVQLQQLLDWRLPQREALSKENVFETIPFVRVFETPLMSMPTYRLVMVLTVELLVSHYDDSYLNLMIYYYSNDDDDGDYDYSMYYYDGDDDDDDSNWFSSKVVYSNVCSTMTNESVYSMLGTEKKTNVSRPHLLLLLLLVSLRLLLLLSRTMMLTYYYSCCSMMLMIEIEILHRVPFLVVKL